MAVASVSSGTSSVELLASATGENRRGVIVENSDANTLYVLMGVGTASSTNYSFSLPQNANAMLPDYEGDLQGVWAADGTGAAMVTTY